MRARLRHDLRKHAITRLRTAFRRNNLCLYVGAGASASSGVPTWQDLVLTVFLNSLDLPGGTRPEDAALKQAVGERWFAQNRVPLEIVARELRRAFNSPDMFTTWVYFGLYQRFGSDSKGRLVGLDDLGKENKTLAAIVSMCRNTKPGRRGLRSIVTYNLDGLLEVALGSYPFQSTWKQQRVDAGCLPIYHVHGYLPARDPFKPGSQKHRSTSDEIVLTEDQYHREADNPYSWSNLVQLQAMSGSIGLTVGLSLVDPNMRRLLDVSKRLPLRPEMYALVTRPEMVQLSDRDLSEIGKRTRRAFKFYAGFYREPPPMPDVRTDNWRKRVRKTWSTLARISARRQTNVLRELGVEPIWCKHSEIPGIVKEIVHV